MTRLLLAALVLCATAPVLAQTAEDLSGKVDETIATEAQTQDLKDAWATEKGTLEDRHRIAKGNVAWLRERIAVENQRAAALDQNVGELERRLTESTRLQAVIGDSLLAVLNRLENVVATDLPFLAAERQQRLASLRSELARPEVESAEKLRRLLEGLLVEAQYGETVEVTQERITVDGVETFVDLMRLGRLTMFWRTPDGAQVGTWDPVSKSFVTLPGRYSRTLQKSMEMASRMRPVQLLSLPLGRIAP